MVILCLKSPGMLCYKNLPITGKSWSFLFFEYICQIGFLTLGEVLSSRDDPLCAMKMKDVTLLLSSQGTFLTSTSSKSLGPPQDVTARWAGWLGARKLHPLGCQQDLGRKAQANFST